MLREHHHQVTERDVIVTSIPNAPGALAPVLRLVTDANVNVEYAYGGAAEGSPTGDRRPRRRGCAAGGCRGRRLKRHHRGPSPGHEGTKGHGNHWPGVYIRSLFFGYYRYNIEAPLRGTDECRRR